MAAPTRYPTVTRSTWKLALPLAFAAITAVKSPIGPGVGTPDSESNSSSPASEPPTPSPAKVEVAPTRQGLRPRTAPRRGRRGLPRDGGAPRHQVDAPPLSPPDDYEEHPDDHLDQRRPRHIRTRGRDHDRDRAARRHLPPTV